MVSSEPEVAESGDTCYLSGDIENLKDVESSTLRYAENAMTRSPRN